MSSLRNAVKTQKIHRERHQPLKRDHLGPLEKKKDYLKRARCQKEKKNILRKLQRKALAKNPDEFNFHMVRSELRDGVHFEKVEDEEISISNVREDLTYITHRRSVERKKIEKLKAQLHLIGTQGDGMDGVPPNKHILFVDSEKEAKTADVAKLLDTHPSLISRPFNRLRTSQLSHLSLADDDTKRLNVLSKERNKAYKELARRIERENKLRILQDKLEVRRKLLDRKMKNEPLPVLQREGSKDAAPIYKWPQVRKK